MKLICIGGSWRKTQRFSTSLLNPLDFLEAKKKMRVHSMLFSAPLRRHAFPPHFLIRLISLGAKKNKTRSFVGTDAVFRPFKTPHAFTRLILLFHSISPKLKKKKMRVLFVAIKINATFRSSLGRYSAFSVLFPPLRLVSRRRRSI